MAQAPAIAKGYGNRSQLIWRQTEPLFGIAALLWGPTASGTFDLYVTAAIAAVFKGDVPEDLPRVLDAARELEGIADENLGWPGGALEHPGTVEHLMATLLDNNDRSFVDGSEGPDIRQRARAQRWGKQEWVSSEVSRRRALALVLEPLLLARVEPEDSRSEHDAAIRHDRQMLRQVLWLLSPDSALTLQLRTAMSGRSVHAVAAACGVSPSTITLWKRGGAKPRTDRYEVLATALGTEFAALAAAAEDSVPASWPLDPGERFRA